VPLSVVRVRRLIELCALSVRRAVWKPRISIEHVLPISTFAEYCDAPDELCAAGVSVLLP